MADHWQVGEEKDGAPSPAKDDQIVVTAGGGGLSMNIAKCDGAISDAAFSR